MGNHEAVTYSGPTYIANQSAEHSSLTAATHSSDFNQLFNEKPFDSILNL